ncbi:hypothetical protein AB0I35_17265 [Nocardia sp. NPDC050378]|uniref:hypothetical protein n=1 Tax=Nocardia sp. NPDC050378 TaxID=3155400 RepID=UPI00340395FC
MKKKVFSSIGLALAAAATAIAVTAPTASADTASRGACLTIVNNTPKAIRIVMRTTPIGNQPGWSHDVAARSRAVLKDGNRNSLLSPDGTWNIDAPAGKWWFDGRMREGACNGSWYYTVN